MRLRFKEKKTVKVKWKKDKQKISKKNEHFKKALKKKYEV